MTVFEASTKLVSEDNEDEIATVRAELGVLQKELP